MIAAKQIWTWIRRWYSIPLLLVVWQVAARISHGKRIAAAGYGGLDQFGGGGSSIGTSPASPTKLACLMRCIRISGVSSV